MKKNIHQFDKLRCAKQVSKLHQSTMITDKMKT